MAFGVGVGSVLAGAPVWIAPLGAALLTGLPKTARRGRDLPWWLWAAAVCAGSTAAAASGERACGPRPMGAQVAIEGRFLAAPVDGSGPFVVVGLCGSVTVVLNDPTPAAGVLVRVVGRWREGNRRPWFAAESATGVADDRARGPRLETFTWAAVRWRGALVERIHSLYGEQAPMVAALTLARREGLDTELREAFARSGLAHLLAISGFHVGVVTGLVLALLHALGLAGSSARLGAVGVTWVYVGLIGFPDAAFRAALILALVALSVRKGRPPARWGALASAFLILVLLDPTRASEPGFQLSFAGAAGLVAWVADLRRVLRGTFGAWMPEWVTGALASGGAATLATLPVVAWHFERVSLVGIPATLFAAPLVALALPGAILSLVVDPHLPPPRGLPGRRRRPHAHRAAIRRGRLCGAVVGERVVDPTPRMAWGAWGRCRASSWRADPGSGGRRGGSPPPPT